MSSEAGTGDEDLGTTRGHDSSSDWPAILGFKLLASWGASIHDNLRRTVAEALLFGEIVNLCADGFPLPLWIEIIAWIHPRYWILRKLSPLLAWMGAVGLFVRLRLLHLILGPALQEELTALYSVPVESPEGLAGASYHEVAHEYACGILRGLTWKSDPRLALELSELTRLRRVGDEAVDIAAELDCVASVMDRLKVILDRWPKARRGVRRCGVRVDLDWLLARVQDESVRAKRRASVCDDGSAEVEIQADANAVAVALERLNGLVRRNPDDLAKGLHEWLATGSCLVAGVVDVFRLMIPSGYRELDEHVNRLLEDLRKKDPGIETEILVLVPMLRSLTAVVGAFAQGGDMKEKMADGIDERALQSWILPMLRQRLGSDVQSHLSEAGGVVDIRYRGLILELKVERKTASRDAIARKYAGQVVAYQAGEFRRVGIVFVLDMTGKDLPPGDARDGIRVVDVPTHGSDGGESKYPSYVFVLVANGNIRDPSSYSN